MRIIFNSQEVQVLMCICTHVLTFVVGDDITILISLLLNLPLCHWGVESLTPQLVRMH